MALLFWFFPYVILSASCDMMLASCRVVAKRPGNHPPRRYS